MFDFTKSYLAEQTIFGLKHVNAHQTHLKLNTVIETTMRVLAQ